MSKDELLDLLRSLHEPDGDHETQHALADDLLLAYIDDADITKAFLAIKRWYA